MWEWDMFTVWQPWLWIYDSTFRISWERRQPLGDRFNHVFIFFQFPFCGRFVLSPSPASKTTATTPTPRHSVHPGPVCVSLFLPCAPLIAHQSVLWHLRLSKNVFVCLCAQRNSAVVGRGIRKRQEMYYYLCLKTVIIICWDLERI